MTFLQWSQALLTPVLGAIGSYIAWQQWRTNHHRLRHDLFESRYSIYRSAVEFIGSIMREGTPTQAAQDAFLIGTQGVGLLLGDAVAEYLHELWVDAIDLETHQNIFADLPIGEARTKEIEAAGKIKKRLPDHFSQIYFARS